MIIAVDGPAASGKGTLAAGLARHYGLPHLDTGLLYRAVGRAVRDDAGTPGFEAAAIAAARALDPSHLSNVEELQSGEVGQLASQVAVIGPVREALRQFQRDFAHQKGGAVLDGRDIGTVICPDAEVKLFVTASLEERTRRRLAELRARGEQISFEELQAQIAERDERDMTRRDSPLYQAADTHLLDTTLLSIEAAAAAAYAIVDRVMAARS